MISADAMGDRIAQLLEDGATGYLTKPYRVTEFLGMIEKTLRAELDVPPAVSHHAAGELATYATRVLPRSPLALCAAHFQSARMARKGRSPRPTMA